MNLLEYLQTNGNKRYDFEYLYGMTGHDLIHECTASFLECEVFVAKWGSYDTITVDGVTAHEITPEEYEAHNQYWVCHPPFPEEYTETQKCDFRDRMVKAQSWRLDFPGWVLDGSRQMPTPPSTCSLCDNPPLWWVLGRPDAVICEECYYAFYAPFSEPDLPLRMI